MSLANYKRKIEALDSKINILKWDKKDALRFAAEQRIKLKQGEISKKEFNDSIRKRLHNLSLVSYINLNNQALHRCLRLKHEIESRIRGLESLVGIAAVFFIIIVSFALFRFSGITGFVIGPEAEIIEEEVDLYFNESASYNLILQENIDSFLISGSYSGSVKVYLNDINNVVLDSDVLSSAGMTSVTGMAISDLSSSSSNETPELPVSLVVPGFFSLAMKDSFSLQIVNNLDRELNEITLSAVSSNKNVTLTFDQAYYSSLTANEIIETRLNVDTPTLINYTILLKVDVYDPEYGINKTIAVETINVTTKINETPEINLTPEFVPTNITPKINITPENITQEIKIIEFKDVCVDTCFLDNVDKNITLIIDIKNGSVGSINISKIKYKTHVEKINITPENITEEVNITPENISEVPEINVTPEIIENITTKNVSILITNNLNYDIEDITLSASSQQGISLIFEKAHFSLIESNKSGITPLRVSNFNQTFNATVKISYSNFTKQKSINETVKEVIFEIGIITNITSINETLVNKTIIKNVTYPKNISDILKERLLLDNFSRNIKLISIEEVDGKHNLFLELNLNNKIGYANISGIEDISQLEFIQTGEVEDSIIKSAVFSLNNINFSKAKLKLPKEGIVNKILKCDFWNQEKFYCGNWKITDIGFTQDNNFVYFDVDSFSGYGAAFIDANSEDFILKESDKIYLRTFCQGCMFKSELNPKHFCPQRNRTINKDDFIADILFDISDISGNIEYAKICAFQYYKWGSLNHTNYVSYAYSSEAAALEPYIESGNEKSFQIEKNDRWYCIEVTEFIQDIIQNKYSYAYIRLIGPDLEGGPGPYSCFKGFDDLSRCNNYNPSGADDCRPYLLIER